MLKRKWKKRISEYLDNATSAPHTVQQFIEKNPDAALYLKQLSDISKALQDLPPPPCSDNFTHKIMTRIKQIDEEHYLPRWHWVGLPATAAALLVIIIFTIFILYDNSDTSKKNSLSSAVEIEQLTQIIEKRVYNGENIVLEEPSIVATAELFGEIYPNTESDTSPINEITPEILEYMLATLDSESDIFSVIESLENGEVSTLRELLAEYVQEG